MNLYLFYNSSISIELRRSLEEVSNPPITWASLKSSELHQHTSEPTQLLRLGSHRCRSGIRRSKISAVTTWGLSNRLPVPPAADVEGRRNSRFMTRRPIARFQWDTYAPEQTGIMLCGDGNGAVPTMISEAISTQRRVCVCVMVAIKMTSKCKHTFAR